MDFIDTVSRPTLLADQKKIRQNIRFMVEKAAKNGAKLRPHFKTHQSGIIGNWFRDYGIEGITVSSVGMAAYFFQHGWKDITIAFPVNLREVDAINRLLELGAKLNLLVESSDVAIWLSAHIKQELGVWIKLDSGAARTGIPFAREEQILELCHLIDALPKLILKGLLTHAGHTYSAKSRDAIRHIAQNAVDCMTRLREASGIDGMQLSWGDTPSCSMLEPLQGFDEWRPGNFVFYDLMQYHIGSCSLDQIAVAMACPVVAIHPDRNQLVIYGGSVHFSAAFIAADDQFRLYGYLVLWESAGWSAPVPGAYVCSLSQEHGIVQLPKEMIKRFKPGDIVGILPVHSCLTVNAMGQMLDTKGQLIPCFR
jgi:D-serine deaminase-like pyridoxal phosphate-dependent protein